MRRFLCALTVTVLAACSADQKQVCEATCRVGDTSVALGASVCDPGSAITRLLCVTGADDCPTLVSSACGALATCSQNAQGAVCCTNECSPGDKVCTTGGLATCGNFDGDPCVELGPAAACGSGETCVGGACCTQECDAGQSRCDDNGDQQNCGYFDADACREWGPAVDCALPATCRGGACCVDECSSDVVECAGSQATRRCGQYDADGCLDWSLALNCPGTQECHAGACCADACQADTCDGSTATRDCLDPAGACRTLAPPQACSQGTSCHPEGVCCADECDQIATHQCSANQQSIEECGNYDSDPCLEWGGPSEICDGAEVCHTDSEAFPATQCCVDACSDDICSSSNQYRLCRTHASVADLDPCLDLAQAGTCTGNGAQCYGTGDCCANSCTAGPSSCAGPTASQACVANGDADPCLELKTTNCVGAEICLGGACCADGCSEGPYSCQNNRVVACAANWDADGCSEYPVSGQFLQDCSTEGKLCQAGACVVPTASCGGGAQDSFTDLATGHCYALFDTITDWPGAEALCVGEGGHLASIASAEENDALSDAFGGVSASAWIGLTDAASEGTYVWSDGTPFGYTNWYTNEPDPIEDCSRIMLSSSIGAWFDLDCAYNTGAYLICEKVP